MRPVALLFATFILLSGLTACGQKGPLYLPESEPAEKASQV